MYMALATLAILDLCANCNLHAYGLADEQATATAPPHTHHSRTTDCHGEPHCSITHAATWPQLVVRLEELLTSIAVLLAAHAILLLSTVVHATPTLAPYNFLVWCMRACAFIFLLASSMRCAKYYVVGPGGMR